MAKILRNAWEVYNYLFDELVDDRTKDRFLVGKPYQVLLLLFIYVMFVLKWGPKWMKRRPAYNLDRILIAYNAMQVIACSYLFVSAIITAWGWDYKWICEPLDRSRNYKPMQITYLVYLYFSLKVLDLFDTVFFVLRKKFNQVTFLHLYHHTGMVLLVWGAITYLPGGHGTLVGVINAFVHIVMYSYYLLTVAVPSTRKSMWWKKYITQLQILQFFLNVVHMGSIVFVPDCEYPRWTSAVFLPQNLFMLVLFVDFYIKTYIRKPKTKENKKRTSLKEGLGNGKQHIIGNGTSKSGTAVSNGYHKINDNSSTVRENGKLD